MARMSFQSIGLFKIVTGDKTLPGSLSAIGKPFRSAADIDRSTIDRLFDQFESALEVRRNAENEDGRDEHASDEKANHVVRFRPVRNAPVSKKRRGARGLIDDAWVRR